MSLPIASLIGDTIKDVAPTLASLVGGPVAGSAVKFITDEVLGKPSASLEEVRQGLANANSDQLHRLHTVDQALHGNILSQFLSDKASPISQPPSPTQSRTENPPPARSAGRLAPSRDLIKSGSGMMGAQAVVQDAYKVEQQALWEEYLRSGGAPIQRNVSE